jgi:hypothetical protein
VNERGLTRRDEAAAAVLPVRLKVASSNDRSASTCASASPIAELPAYIELEWPG